LDKSHNAYSQSRKYSPLKKIAFLSTAFLSCGIPLAQAEEITSFSQERIASNSIESTSVERELEIKKPVITHDPSKCDEFDNPRSIHCLGPVKATQPTNRVDRFIQGAASYASKLVPLLNNNSEGSAYSNLMINDGKSLIVDKGYGFANNAANSQIQKIPFFAQTSVAINPASESATSFTIDSLMKLKDMGNDSDGDLKTLLFGQARATTTTDTKGSTTNLGLGLRHRPNDNSMVGGNVFWDYRMTDYSTAHSRIGLGGEYFWKDFEVRHNNYMATTDAKTVTINGSSYNERIVPGWDVEVGYRLPKYPQLGVFVKGYNWDYLEIGDRSGVATSLNWQATENVNLEAYVSSEISGNGTTKENSSLHGSDDYQVGLQVKWTGRPVKFKKNNVKKNLVTQMTQPVRRRYDVLLERSNGVTFQVRGG